MREVKRITLSKGASARRDDNHRTTDLKVTDGYGLQSAIIQCGVRHIPLVGRAFARRVLGRQLAGSILKIAGQLEDTRRAIAAHAHVRVDLFRPPYGLRNAAVDRVARQLGMLEVLWNVDSFDWAGADAKGIARNVLNHVSPGAIVLMHENRGQTIKALKFILLPALRRLRYRLVTVPELLAVDPPTAAQLHRGLSGCSNNSASPGVLRFGSATVRSSRAQP